VVATHDAFVADQAQRKLTLCNGTIATGNVDARGRAA
jgi:hypothetical protein